MPFPHSITGSFAVTFSGLPKPNLEKVGEAYFDWLRLSPSIQAQYSPESISFTQGFFNATWSFHPLRIYNRGAIKIEAKGDLILVAYKFSMKTMVLLYSGLLFFLFIGLFVFSKGSVAISVFVPIIFWFWLIGGTYALQLILVPRKLKKIACAATGGRIS
ncbi:MAG: hypothetical protein AAF530_19655 [Pseudomonadota bacterium]